MTATGSSQAESSRTWRRNERGGHPVSRARKARITRGAMHPPRPRSNDPSPRGKHRSPRPRTPRGPARAPSPIDACTNVLDFEAIARGRMEQAFYDYYAGGAEDELTLAANRSAFSEVFLRPRVLVDVSRIETAGSVLGASVSMPVLIAPTA